jgi:DNA-directed RNA polymerase I, II, and III subunit RPABC5
MIIPVKCFTCGNVLGNKYLFYIKEVEEQKKDRKIDSEDIQYLSESHIEKTIEGEVLDRLNLKKQCCRRHMLTHVDVF